MKIRSISHLKTFGLLRDLRDLRVWNCFYHEGHEEHEERNKHLLIMVCHEYFIGKQILEKNH